MKTEQIGVVTSIKNESGDTILKGYFVNMDGMVGNSSENNNAMIGVCIADTNDNEMMPVAVTGIVLCVTGGAISKGNPVTCDGQVIKASFSATPTTAQLQSVVGKALDSSTGANQLIRVLLK